MAGVSRGNKKPTEKDSSKLRGSEEAAEDQEEDEFFRSDIDDLLTGEIDTTEQKLFDQGSISEEGLTTAGTLSKTSDLPLVIEDIIEETERIVSGNNTRKAPSVAASGRKAGLQSKSSQRPAPFSRKPVGEIQQDPVVPPSAVPMDKAGKQRPKVAENRGASVPKTMQGQGPRYYVRPVATANNAPAPGPGKKPPMKPIPNGAAFVGKNRAQEKLPPLKPLNEVGTVSNPATQTAGLLTAGPVRPHYIPDVISPTLPSPTVPLRQNWTVPAGKGGQNAVQRAVGTKAGKRTSIATQPPTQRRIPNRHHSSHRRHSRDGHSSSVSSSSSSSSDEYPRYHHGHRRGSRHRERRRRSSDSVYRRYRDDVGRDRLHSRDGIQHTALPYSELASWPQAPAFQQPQAYSPVPPVYAQQAPAYPSTPRFATTYEQQPAVPNYAANPIFPPSFNGPPRVQEVRWGPNVQRYGPQPVVAPPRPRGWLPGFFGPRYYRTPSPPPTAVSASYAPWPIVSDGSDTCRCRQCCGDCCRQAAASRREQERWRWTPPPPPVWTPPPRPYIPREPAFAAVRSTPSLWPTTSATPYWPPPATPTRHFAWSTRYLPPHVWSTGGSFLSRSHSWPQLGSRFNEGPIQPRSSFYVSGTDVSAPLSRTYEPPRKPAQRSASATAATSGGRESIAPARPSVSTVWSSAPVPPQQQASTGTVNVRSTVSFVDLTQPRRSEPSMYKVIYSVSSCCPSEEEPYVKLASSEQKIVVDTAVNQPTAANATSVVGPDAGLTEPRSTSPGPAAVLTVSVVGSVPSSSPSTVVSSLSSPPIGSDSSRSFSAPDAWRFPTPVLVEGVQAVPFQDTSHGWYQPLHIVSQSQGSDSSSQQPLIPVVLAPAEQDLLTGAMGGYPAGGDLFFDFSWDAPEEGARRSRGSARRAYESAPSGAEAGKFSWSSDELLDGRALSMSQESGASEAEAELGAAMEEAGEYFAETEDEVPVAMETNMLRSMTSEGDMNYAETKALESTADMHQVDEEAEEEREFLQAAESGEAGEYGEVGEYEEDREYREVGEYGEATSVVPVIASMAEMPRQVEAEESQTSSETVKVVPIAAVEGAQLNPETGVPEDVPDAEEPPSPPSPPAVEAPSSPPITELIDEKRLEADRSAEQVEKEMRDLELTTVDLYPESRLVLLLALLCLIWILFLIITAAVRHDLRTTTTEATAASDHTSESSSAPTEERETPHCPTSVSTSVSVITNGSSITTEEPLQGTFVCSTEYCKKEGDYIRDLISKSSKKPCEDFYEHICEGWKVSASGLRDNQPGAAVSTDTLLQGAMENQLLNYIKNSTQADVVPARALYERCMNRAEADAALLETKELFRRWGSEWPCTGTGGTSTDVWTFAAKILRVLGVPSLVGVEIGLEPRNLDETIIEVGPPKSIFFSKDASEARVVAIFTEAAQSAAKALSPQEVDVPKATATDVSTALTALAPLRLDDLGTSPLDFEVENLGSLGKSVQIFLGALFEHVAVLDGNKRIMIHRGRLVRRDLEETVNKVAPRAILNYLGLLALVALSPFLPDNLASLRVLHSVHSIGRAETPTNEQLCMRAASQAFPASIAKASEIVHNDVRRSVWLSQLEALFVGFVNNVTWMDNLTSLLVKYKMRHHRVARFFPAWPPTDCKPAEVSGKAKALGAFVDAVSYRQLQELQQYGRKPFKPSTGSPLAVWARYRLCLQLLQIPVGLVNVSVPTNGTVFALHLSRFAVRLYAGLAQLLYEGTLYELEIPLYFTEEAERKLDQLIDCLLSDARSQFPTGLEADRVRNALLEQVLALQLAFLAFRQLLGLRRIWHHDFQLLTLPNVTSDQLFFIYYALDHCELSDDVYESHQFEAHRLLPASVRVNAALRQSAHFSRAFNCEPGSQMSARETCGLLR